MKIRIFLVIIPLMLAACQSRTKDDTLTQTANLSSKNATVVTSAGPENPGNPYDSTGRLHNEILELLHQHLQATGDSSNAGARKFLAAYFKKYRGTDIADALSKVPDDLSMQIISDYRKVIFATNWHPATDVYLRTIFDTISQAGGGSFDMLKVKIVEIEKQILQDHTIPGREKHMLLYTTSIARYSAYYCNHVLDQHRGEQLAGKGFWHAIKRALAIICTCMGDASGAAYAYLLEEFDKMLGDADFLSFMTWGGLTYYNNW